MATRTAPTVGALTVSENLIGLSLMDASGDKFSESIKTVGGALADMAEVEAVAAAYQAASQASLFEVRMTQVWTGSANPTNADVGQRNSIADGINMAYRDTDVFNAVFGGRLIAPVAATMVGNSDDPVYPLVVPLSTLVAAYITLLGVGYSLESLQYTERRERKNNAKKYT